MLIRDVAYRRLLKSDRAALHERFADWVHSGGSSGAVDPEQQVARHIDAAHGFRCDLGLRDARTATTGIALGAGLPGRRPAGVRPRCAHLGGHAGRARRGLAAERSARAELLQVGCEALLSAGDVAAGAPLVDQLDRVADDALAQGRRVPVASI